MYFQTMRVENKSKNIYMSHQMKIMIINNFDNLSLSVQKGTLFEICAQFSRVSGESLWSFDGIFHA